MHLQYCMRFTLYFTIVLIMISCDSNDESLTENSRLESQISSQSQIQADNENTQIQALKLENDLKNRMKFFQAVRGMYWGDLKIAGEEYKIRLTFVPNLTLPDYSSFRTNRRMEEIIHDLTNLGLNIQILHWKKNQPLVAVSCQVDNVKPDLKLGKITISTQACPNYYELEISDEASFATPSVEIMDDIYAGKLEKVVQMKGLLAPSSNPDVFKFTVREKSGGL